MYRFCIKCGISIFFHQKVSCLMLQESDCKEEQAKNRVKKKCCPSTEAKQFVAYLIRDDFFQLFKLISAIFL